MPLTPPQPNAHMSIHACTYICIVMLFLCYVMYACVFFLFVAFLAQLAVQNRCCCVARPSYPPSFFLLLFFSPLGMPLTAAESSFKNWLESESCVQYWIVDPSCQQPRLLKTWTRAQIEYDRIKEKEKQSNLHKEKPIE